MYLIFSMLRPDVLPLDDAARRRAMIAVYEIDGEDFEPPGERSRKHGDRIGAWLAGICTPISTGIIRTLYREGSLSMQAS